MFCKNCGNKLKENDRFCGECGIQVTEMDKVIPTNAPIAQTSNTNTAKASNPRQLKLIIGVVALVAVLTVGYFVFRGLSENPRSPQQIISLYYDELSKSAEKKIWPLYSTTFRSSYSSMEDTDFIEDIAWESNWYKDRYGSNWTSRIILSLVEQDENHAKVQAVFPDGWEDYFDLVKEQGVWKINRYYYNGS